MTENAGSAPLAFEPPGVREAYEVEARSIERNGGRFRGLMVSETPHWRTPKAVYDDLDREFHFTFDPCPPEPDFDGLMVEWGDRNFVNPPYGKVLATWIEKAYREHLNGKLSVLLIPARTDTAWWHDYCMRADEIRFVRGRIQFEAFHGMGGKGGLGSAPFPSAIVVFRGER